MAMLHTCPVGRISAPSWFGWAHSARRDRGSRKLPPQHAVIPISVLLLCCNRRGKKKTKPQQPFWFLQTRALFCRLVLPPAFSNSHLSLSPLSPLRMRWVCRSWEVYSANLAGHVPAKNIQVCLAGLASGGLCRHPDREGSGGCGGDAVPASPGRMQGISLPALARRRCLAS